MVRPGSRANGGVLEYAGMGDRLRAARLARGLSLRALADRLGVSASLISQVETGRAKPSVSTLYAIVNELAISLDELLFPDAGGPSATSLAGEPAAVFAVPTGSAATAVETAPPAPVSTTSAVEPASYEPVQPAGSRARIRLASGVVWERLTTVSMPNVDFLYVTYEVGGASSPEHEFQRHQGQEWGYILSGTLGVTVGFDEYVLHPGDAVSFESTTPHRLYNLGDEPVHAIWFVAGRRPVDMTAAANTD